MNLNIGTKLGGFVVERIRESKELGGRLVEMRHEGCGAELLWMDNGDSNKLFSVAFKTLPEDHTGVFHILEHSVLCGSEKYPVKEPFVDLMKSSMNTFLNAMTFQDKTMYPISSRNERDYLNLASVYLDAVFAPLSVRDENAFRQEGWHLEKNEGEEPYFNGVVYNEMKGAMAGLDEILEEGMNSLLFPDNCYGFNSGGDPEHIPELTYGMYCTMYHKYYHPSNARFYLDGSVPLEKTIELIEEYIGNIDKQDAAHDIPMQTPIVSEKTLYYEIAPNDDEANKTVLSFGRIIGSFEQKHRALMSAVLCSYLAGTNDSPLTRAILDAGLGEDVDLFTTYDIQQSKLVLTVKNTEKEKLSAIRETIKKVIAELAENGLDKQMLTAQLNRFAFNLKNMWEPAGLARCIMAATSSLYGGDPMLYMENDADIEAIRASIENGEFEALLKELYDFDKMCTLTVLPSKTRGEELAKKAADWAKELYEWLDESSLAELDRKNTRLHAWQQEPDSEEHTAMLPVLPLSEVGKEPMLVPTELREVNGVKLMFHPLRTNGITHINLYFNASDLGFEDIPKASLLAKLLSKLPTKKHTAQELDKLIKTYIGRLKFSVSSANLNPKACVPHIAASFSALDENAEQAAEIVAEILLETDFSDVQRIRENVTQLDEATKQHAVMSGDDLGASAVRAQFSSSAACEDQAAGVGFRMFIKQLAFDFDANSKGLEEDFGSICARTFCRERLMIGAAAQGEFSAEKLIGLLPNGEAAPENAQYETKLPARLGIRIPAQVAFAEKGIDIERLTGDMVVAANIIRLSYLWTKVRVQGGAYGCGLRTSESGIICHWSYRDPSPARTLGVYDEDSAFIREFCEGGEELDKFIISAIGRTEPLIAPEQMAAMADIELMNGFTAESKRQRRAEMLAVSRESLLKLCDTFDRCAKDGAVCVVGGDAQLAEIEGLNVIDI